MEEDQRAVLALPSQNLLLIRTVFDLKVNCRENPKTNLSNHRLKKTSQNNTTPKHIYQGPCLNMSRFAFVLVFLQNCPKIKKVFTGK